MITDEQVKHPELRPVKNQWWILLDTKHPKKEMNHRRDEFTVEDIWTSHAAKVQETEANDRN